MTDNLMTRYRGKLKWFNITKGYGFITPNSQVPGFPPEKDVFVHITMLQGIPQEKLSVADLPVSFIVGEHKGKLNAMDVRLA